MNLYKGSSFAFQGGVRDDMPRAEEGAADEIRVFKSNSTIQSAHLEKGPTNVNENIKIIEKQFRDIEKLKNAQDASERKQAVLEERLSNKDEELLRSASTIASLFEEIQLLKTHLQQLQLEKYEEKKRFELRESALNEELSTLMKVSASSSSEELENLRESFIKLRSQYEKYVLKAEEKEKENIFFLEQARVKNAQDVQKYESRIQLLESEISRMKLDHSMLEKEFLAQKKRSISQINDSERAELLKSQNELLQSQIRTQQLELDKCKRELDCRLQLVNQDELVNDLRTKCEDLKSQLVIQGMRVSNMELLQRQLDCTRATILSLEESQRDYNKMKVELGRLREQKKYWQKLSVDFDVVEENGATLRDILEGQVRSNELLEEQNKKLLGRIRDLQDENVRLKGVVESLEGVNGDLERFKELVNQSEAKIRLLEGQKASLEKLLGSYRREQQGVEGSGLIMKRTIDHYIGQLEEYGRLNDKLKRELDEKELKIIDFEKWQSLLSRENEQLRSRVGRGEYDTGNFKVLHYSITPDTLGREKEVEKLRLKANELMEQLECLKTGNSITVSSNQWERLQEEVEHLKLKERENSISKQRLLEITKSKIQLIKNIVFHIFGWIIEFSESSLINMRSVYSPRNDIKYNDEYLVFDYRKGRMLMLESPFSAIFDDQIKSLLGEDHALPGVVAKLTLLLYERHKNRMTLQ